MGDILSIEKADILRGLSKGDLAEISEIAEEQEFKCGERLFERGEEATTFYIATRGLFALTVELRVFDGTEEFALEEKGALDAFGWSALVEPRTSIYSGYCIEEGAVLAFSRKRLEALLMTNRRLGEEFQHNLNELIGTRARTLQEHWLEEISQSTARVRELSHTTVTAHWQAAMMGSQQPSPQPVRGWIRKHMHLGAEN
ncbi:MAG: cyclic nucleotide-binding domain-containing protein [Deltaproteobacteria bacterium]|nr:cyclic nucleotide-binding domain-containing protein [Deltaproteobacteria bacterium]